MVWLHQGQTSQTKSSQTEQDRKMAGSIWLPGPEVSRKLPELIRWCQTAPEFPFVYIKDTIWCCLAESGQLPSRFLQTSGAGSLIEPAIFWSCSVWDDFVWFVWSWCNHTIKRGYLFGSESEVDGGKLPPSNCRGYIRVALSLRRPIHVAAGTRPPSIYNLTSASTATLTRSDHQSLDNRIFSL